MAMQSLSLLSPTMVGSHGASNFSHSAPPLHVHPVRPSFKQLPQLRSRSVVAFQAPPSAQINELHEKCETTKTNVVTKKYANINWDKLTYIPTPTDYMYIMECPDGENFTNGNLIPYGNIELSPSSGVINYGEGVFEGLKAYRREDGRITLFRPDQNAVRMTMSAERMCMPSPSVEKFVDAVKKTVIANEHWVPPPGKGALYIRPLLIGSGSVLSPGPSSKYKFLIYVTPVGNSHHKGGKAVNLIVEEKVRRATLGGTGGIKSITNYSPVYRVMSQAKAKGFSDVLFLDAESGKNIEEVSTSNIFIIKGNVVSTPPLNGTVLPGITRKSIIDIALHLNYQVEERVIPVEELLDANEVFCTGTAVVVNSVGSVTYKGKRTEYRTGPQAVSQKLNETLTGIQKGLIEDKMGWTVMLDSAVLPSYSN